VRFDTALSLSAPHGARRSDPLGWGRLDDETKETRTTGFEAGKLAVSYWRDLFALNYQVLKLPSGALPDRTEPSVSHWSPSTPSVTG